MGQNLVRHTIFALSSGKLPSGVAVIRVSGPGASHVVQLFCGAIPAPRIAALKELRAIDGRVLDQALVLWFPGPRSFTGEDCVEFQCHGGAAVVAAMLSELGAIEGCRLAEAGEFSLRAFTNGKADLTQLESLADLIDAETEGQRALAVAGVNGAQKKLYESWRRDLLRARAFLEADLDFADEDDVPGSVASAADQVVADLVGQLQLHLKTYRTAEILRDGFKVVIAGPPNAGKSTLLNTLAKRDVAIVTDMPGTTRDIVEVALDLGGIKVVIADTAGLRETDDIIEEMGIKRAHSAIGSADLVLMLSQSVPASTAEFLENVPPVWHVKTKCDLDTGAANGFSFAISCQSGLGLSDLVAALSGAAKSSVGSLLEGKIVTRARHVALLENALLALSRFEGAGERGAEFAAEELRIAAENLGRITGIISTEDVLGEIFSSFCIGK